MGAKLGENLVFLENEEFLVVDFDVVPAILAEQVAVADFYIELDAVALFVEFAGADCDNFAFLGFLFGRVRDDYAALCSLLLRQPAYQDSGYVAA